MTCIHVVITITLYTCKLYTLHFRSFVRTEVCVPFGAFTSVVPEFVTGGRCQRVAIGETLHKIGVGYVGTTEGGQVGGSTANHTLGDLLREPDVADDGALERRLDVEQSQMRALAVSSETYEVNKDVMMSVLLQQ